jgi:hypothetical protein
MECLAALAGAGVPPRLARLGRAGDADQLGGQVLDLELPLGELFGAEKVLRAGEVEGVGRMISAFAGKEGLGEGVRGAGAGADPEGGIAL